MTKQQREVLRQQVEANKRMKAEQENGSILPVAPPKPPASVSTAAKPPNKAQPQKVKPPVIGTEEVHATCGHPVAFELFALKADKFRDARRAKLTDKACPACRKEAQAVKEAKERAERAERAAVPPKKPKGAGRMNENQRLPHQSSFMVQYDAEKKMWSGALFVNGVKFSGEASGVFRLLTTLDRHYRQSLWKEPTSICGSSTVDELCT